MIRILFLILVLFAVSCSAATTTAVSTVQAVGSPVHILPEANAAFVSDINLQGMGVCSEGDFTITIEWDSGTDRTKVAEFEHRGQLGAAAYGIGRDESGWFVDRMSSEDGAKRYPLPFARCAQPAALRAPTPRIILWRESPTT